MDRYYGKITFKLGIAAVRTARPMMWESSHQPRAASRLILFRIFPVEIKHILMNCRQEIEAASGIRLNEGKPGPRTAAERSIIW